MINDLHDTFLNVGAFVFIGLLIWLYFKPSAIDKEDVQRDD
jgi:hypothetical protein